MDNTSIYRERWCAEGYDDDRFSGSFGRYLEEREVELYCALIDDHDGSVLDVGAGTGKLSLPLIRAARTVVSTDASGEMLGIAVGKAATEALPMRPAVSDIHDLCFADDSFDCVLCSRVLMHLKDWRKAVSELCRVSGGVVVLDFPPRLSFAGFDGPFKWVRGLFSPRTRGYRTFGVQSVLREFERNGFRIEIVRREFFLPIAVHRRLNRPQLSLAIERLCTRLGLVSQLGAPAIVKAVKIAERSVPD